MKFSTNIQSVGKLIVFLVLFSLSFSCKDDDKSENNSTTVDYNVPGQSTDTLANTSETVITTSDTINRSTPGRTSTGTRKGRVTVTKVQSSPKPTTKMQTDPQGYYNYTETSPAYAGGQQALDNFINKNIEYPQEAIDNNIEGTVFVEFAIDENGKISNARVTGNKIGYGLEEAAIQAITGMPKWTPGQVNGKNVKTWYTLPITFKLEE